MVALKNTANPKIDLPKVYDALSIAGKQLVRAAYIEEQGGLCYYCKASLDGPPDPEVKRLKIVKSMYPANFFKYPVHLHHCHSTGLTIGAVHNYCNAVLWQYHGE